jgi:glutamyl-tRNA synthetase
MSADGRFAPSPTGPLHLGSLRTALVAWLFTRSQGGRFLVRVEDLDPQRSRRELEREQLADLRALGIDWDGEPVRQSERVERYHAALGELEDQGRLYPCFCTRAEMREAASAPHGALPEGSYPGTCAKLAAAEARRRIAEGRQFALRVRAEGEVIGFDDRLAGRHAGAVDDFVVRRADGVPADRGEPKQASLALLAHTLGLAPERSRVESASELIGEFDPDRLPRDPVVLGDGS